jgi:methionyl-tRNA formyltransferase
MNAYVYPTKNPGHPAYVGARDALRDLGIPEAPSPQTATVAIAPSLLRILPASELLAPQLGTLILHPSLLPRHRGPDAVRHTYFGDEAYTGATWFWGDLRDPDMGDICEQEIVEIDRASFGSPGSFYYSRLVPAGMVALRRALVDIASGRARRVPQPESAQTTEGAWGRKG